MHDAIPPTANPMMSRDFLLGERPYSKEAELFMPHSSGDFTLVKVAYLPKSIWRNTRRLVKQTHFDDYTSVMTLLIPFHEPDTSYGPFETIWLYGDKGQIIEQTDNAASAYSQHERWRNFFLERGLSETLLS